MPRISNPFNRSETGNAVNAAMPTESFLPLRFAVVNLRLNTGNDRIGRADSSRPTAVYGTRSDVLAGVAKKMAAVLCLTQWTPAWATADIMRNLLPPSSGQQNLIHCKGSQYVPLNRRYLHTRKYSVTYNKRVSRLAVATCWCCRRSMSVYQ